MMRHFPKKAHLPGLLLALCLTLFPGLPATAATAVLSSPYGQPTFYPSAATHPRVYFQAADVPRILANAQKLENSKAWTRFLSYLSTGTDGKLPATSPNFDATRLAIIECYALDYALRADATHGRNAIDAMLNYAASVTFKSGDYNGEGQTVFTIGIVYDWCYPLLTYEEKGTLTDAVARIAGQMEIGWPPGKQGNVDGHGPEGQLQRDLMAFAIAAYDDRPDIYNYVAGRFLNRQVPNKKFFYPMHMHHQGNHYTCYRGQWEMLAALMFKAMGDPEVFGPDQAHVADWLLYARRPDGMMFRDGDTWSNNYPVGSLFKEPGRVMLLAAALGGDPYLKYEAMRQDASNGAAIDPQTPKTNQSINPIEILIFNNPDVAPRPLTELPLTRYFGSPKGEMVARTSWDNSSAHSPAVVAEFKINEWNWNNHQHLDAGHFQIFYRGYLATDSGYYQAALQEGESASNDGNTAYGSLYDVNWNKRSIAHNVMLVVDPNEKFTSTRWSYTANDGGQRFPNKWIEPSEHSQFIDPANGYRTGEVLAHGTGGDALAPDDSYLKGDLTRAYSSKISAYERSFLFLNLKQADHPAILIVFDRVVATDASFRKAWLLHGLEEPTITGNRSVFKDTRRGYTGKLTVDTVFPLEENTTITPVKGNLNTINGVDYKVLPSTSSTACNEGSGYRIEVSPTTPSKTDYFLHVLQVGDHTPDVAPYDVAGIDTPTHAGVVVGDHVAVFAKARDRSAAPVTFSFAGAGTYHVDVADLVAGTWTLRRDGQDVGTVQVAAGDGVARFSVEPGEISLTLPGVTSASAGSGWTNIAQPASGSALIASFEASLTTTATNAAIGISSGAQDTPDGFACLLQFKDGDILANNGGTPAKVGTFEAGTTYHFRLLINVAQQRYSIYMTPPGGAESLLAGNQAFPAGQEAVTSLDNLGIEVEPSSLGGSGTLAVGDVRMPIDPSHLLAGVSVQPVSGGFRIGYAPKLPDGFSVTCQRGAPGAGWQDVPGMTFADDGDGKSAAIPTAYLPSSTGQNAFYRLELVWPQ